MRQAIWQEIEVALEKVRRQNEANAHLRDVFSKPIQPGVDIGYIHTLESEQGLKQMYANMKALEECVTTHAGVRNVYTATVSSIVIQWTASVTSDQVVVEFSQWAPLIAVWVYGSPPAEVARHLNSCLTRLPVTRLFDDEVDELYKRNLYRTLF